MQDASRTSRGHARSSAAAWRDSGSASRRAAAAAPGVTDVSVLGYGDSELIAPTVDAVDMIAAAVRRVRPQVEITFRS